MNESSEALKRAMEPKTDYEKERREKRRKTYNSARYGKVCADCEREFDSGEPVYRVRIVTGRSMFGGLSSTVAPVCKGCAHAEGKYGKRYPNTHYKARPCEACGRPVHDPYSRDYRMHVFCSEACSWKFYNRIRVEERHAARQAVECDECGKEFTPPRKDTKFCSPGCKQRNYRRRKAGDK